MVSSLLHGGGVPDAVLQPGALHYLGRVVEAQAQTMGFQDGFMVIAVVFILALIPAMILAVKRSALVLFRRRFQGPRAASISASDRPSSLKIRLVSCPIEGRSPLADIIRPSISRKRGRPKRSAVCHVGSHKPAIPQYMRVLKEFGRFVNR